MKKLLLLTAVAGLLPQIALADDLTHYIPGTLLNVPNGALRLDPTGAVSQPIKGKADAATVGGVPLSYIIPSLQQQNRLTESIPKGWLDAAGGVAKLDDNKILRYNLIGDVSKAYVVGPDNKTTITLGNMYSQFTSSLLSVVTYGALVDGITDDTSAFSITKSTAAPLQTIYVPAGNTNISSLPTDTSKINFWSLDGTTNKNALLDRIGNDPTETHTAGGGWSFSRKAPIGADPLFGISREDGSTTDPGNGSTAIGINISCKTNQVGFNNNQNCVNVTQKLYSYGSGNHSADNVSVTNYDNSGNNTGSMSGRTTTVSDASGGNSSSAGSMNGEKLILSASNNDDGNKRAGFLVSAQTIAAAPYGAEFAKVFDVRTDSTSYIGSLLSLIGTYSRTLIDLSQATPHVVTIQTTTDTASGTAILHIKSLASGVYPGMVVDAAGIPVGTTVSSISGTDTVVLSKKTTAAISSGSNVVFTTISPWLALPFSQFTQIGDNQHRVIYGDDADTQGNPTRASANHDTVAITAGANARFKIYSQDSTTTHTAVADISKSVAQFEGVLGSSGVVYSTLTDAQIAQIPNPAEGYTVYDTTNKHLMTFDGTSWKVAGIAAYAFSSLPTTPYNGQVAYCPDCYSALKPYNYTGSGIHIHWDGTSWVDALGIPVRHK